VGAGPAVWLRGRARKEVHPIVDADSSPSSSSDSPELSDPLELSESLLELSELESLMVVAADGGEIGELIDVLATMEPEQSTVTAVLIERDNEQLLATWEQVAEIDVDDERVRLNVGVGELVPASLRGDEIALVDSVLDKQVLDVRRRKFVRVQDVALRPQDDRLVVAGVEAGHGAIVRRMGLGFISRRLPKRAGDFVPWEDVNLISVRLSRLNFIDAFAELAELHPADLADVLGQVGPRERGAVLGALNPILAADTLQEMVDELRNNALVEMLPQRAAAVLAEIEPDEAADILAELPDEIAQDLLTLLPDELEAALRGLAGHPEHSAGALMTTDFVTLGERTTVDEALAMLRRERPPAAAITYLYVVDADEGLVGVLSLRDLVVGDGAQAVSELMEDNVIATTIEVGEDEVGRLITKYNLLVLPVVDDERRILGVVTIDDALDAIVPEEWKWRLPRLFR
jgi:magnesium transporter